MTPENFTYWLQGFFEISGRVNTLNFTQVQIIRDHLNLVFDKKTPMREDQDRLEKIYKEATKEKLITTGNTCYTNNINVEVAKSGLNINSLKKHTKIC